MIEHFVDYVLRLLPWRAPPVVNTNQPVTYRRAAELAFEVQDASNLSGVANRFTAVILPAIWAEAIRQSQGTDWVNENPIVTLFLDKMTQLNKSQCMCAPYCEGYGKAFAEVEAIRRGIG